MFSPSLDILSGAVLEYLEYDASLVRWLVATGGTSLSAALWPLNKRDLAFRVMSRIHRAGGSDLATRTIQRSLARATHRERSGQSTGLWACYDAHIRRWLTDPWSASLVTDPKKLLGYRVLVLKSPRERERGVIAIDYSYIFPLFAGLFDVERIARDYYLVLEPSWRGLCTADILSYSKFEFPVFVQTIEPRDTTFIKSLGSNLITVPIAANWWVDHRVMKPDPLVARDLDVIMVAAWSSGKRHWRFFKVLSQLRNRGHKLKVALVGYAAGRSRADIENYARHFGLTDQVEFFEGLSAHEVGRLLARSKVHILWSRKEGANRAIIEAMFANVPIILREGLSYGHPYPYVNGETGRFANEDNLAEVLLDMVNNYQHYHPREWALANMSCQRATQILEESIRCVALNAGERWTTGLAVKTVHLDTQHYWDPEEISRFGKDYIFLESQIRPQPLDGH